MLPQLSINDVLESVTGEAPFDKLSRILWVDGESGDITLLSIEMPPKQPWVMNLEVLTAMLQVGKLQKTTVRTPAFMLELEEDLPEHAKTMRNKNWERIQPLVETTFPGEIFLPRMRGLMVSMHATKTGLPRKTLYRLLYRFWLYGSVRNALLPDRTKSGNPGVSRTFAPGKTPGRPAKYLGETVEVKKGILTDKDKEYIRIGYALYAKNKAKYISDAYQKTLKRYYRAEHPSPNEEEGYVVLKPLSELPSKKQFIYWGKKSFSDMTVLRGRKGEKRWQKDHRELSGRATDGVHGPCHRFEIDATIADIYLVSRYRKEWIIGRPIVYVVADVFSGMITGVFIGLEGPSWDGARHALFNTFTNKVAFCSAHNIEISEDDWPCHHLPQEIMADRAEMLSESAKVSLVDSLKIDLAIASPYRPDWKSIVESRFKLLNDLSQIHWTPGGVRAREQERGDRDYRLDATINLEEFTQIIIVSILHYNRHNRQPSRLNAEMINDGIEPTPLNIWNWGINQGLGCFNPQSDEIVYLHLLPTAQASIQAGGINFKGMFYTSEYATENNWFSRARNKGRTPTKVWYSPWSTEFIWIQDKNRTFHACSLRSSENRYRGMRLEEVIDMLEIISKPSPKVQHDQLNGQVQLDEFIESTIKKSKNSQSATEASAAKRIEGIRTYRQVERFVEQTRLNVRFGTKSKAQPSEQAIPKAPQTVTSVATTYAGERSTQVIDLLGGLHQKGQNS
nr:hypothetical protein [uncultured Deefgea sp.]